MGKIKFLELEKFQKHLLSSYYAPGTVLTAGDTAENETDSVSVFGELPDGGGWVGRQIINQKTKSIINCDKCCLKEPN